MIITNQDRDFLKTIVIEAVAVAISNKPVPVVETRTEPTPEKQRITVQQLLEKVRDYRATLKQHDRVLEKFRNHPFDSKNANRAVENARNNLEKAEEDFIIFCKLVAEGAMIIERGT